MVSYDYFVGSFLSRITEYELLNLNSTNRQELVDGYLHNSISAFKHVCKVDLISTDDAENRQFNISIPKGDLDEIVDIVAEGMVVQWLKQYIYQQELLQNTLNTKDFSTYSPAELLLRVNNAYADAKKNHTQMIREYSYNHGDLTRLHL